MCQKTFFRTPVLGPNIGPVASSERRRNPMFFAFLGQGVHGTSGQKNEPAGQKSQKRLCFCVFRRLPVDHVEAPTRAAKKHMFSSVAPGRAGRGPAGTKRQHDDFFGGAKNAFISRAKGPKIKNENAKKRQTNKYTPTSPD